MFDWVEGHETVITAVAALTAVCLSFVGILLTFLTSARQQRHARLSVRPIGYVDHGLSPSNGSITLRNSGLGPLLVKDLRTYWNGKEEAEPFKSILELLIEENEPIKQNFSGRLWWSYNFRIGNTALRPGGEVSLFSWEYRDLTEKYELPDVLKPSHRRIMKMLSEMEIKIRYSDIYGSHRRVIRLRGEETFFAA
ncbi:hypothetical protein [Parvularcula marina]|uniref:hypothetical protein n=1 Tax=Parvularcula marina TaxID=2292771 RepID=UPI003512F03B